MEFFGAIAPLSVCASITILVPISWLAATLLFGYFIAVLTLGVAHWRVHRGLWFTPIHDVPWFDDKSSSAPQLPPLDTSPIDLSLPPPLLLQSPTPASAPGRRRRGEPAAPPGRRRRRRIIQSEKPLPSSPRPNVWWDRLRPGQAGRDHPFAIRRPVDRVAEHYYPTLPADRRPPRPRPSGDRRGGTASGTGLKCRWPRPRSRTRVLPTQSQPWLEWQRKAAGRDSSSVRFGVESTDGVGVWWTWRWTRTSRSRSAIGRSGCVRVRDWLPCPTSRHLRCKAAGGHDVDRTGIVCVTVRALWLTMENFAL
ncbi:hypothetical protein BC826DRAFT_677944 [Russula brevipes]|nr:hypothetical protein BC826DRAFT_677944 [Russula brevipes]